MPGCNGKPPYYLTAYGLAVKRGFKGTEEEWLESLKGDSAYAVAVSLGYKGTVAEWLISLKGDKGDVGDITPELETLRDAVAAYCNSASDYAQQAKNGADRAEETAKRLSIDSTLSLPGSAADAKAVGDELSKKAPTGLSSGIYKCTTRDEILNVFEEVLSRLNFHEMECITIRVDLEAYDHAVGIVDTWFFRLYKYNNYVAAAEGSSMTSTERVRAEKTAGSWKAWEYENPPMVLNVEYRTTERWNGKAVYTMLMDCGAVPEAGTEKLVNHGASGVNLVLRCTGTLNSGNTLPLDRDGYGAISVMATPTEIILRAGADNASLSGWLTAYCQIWYTKN